MFDGRKPEDVHVATVETDESSISVPEDVTTGVEGRTGKTVVYLRTLHTCITVIFMDFKCRYTLQV